MMLSEVINAAERIDGWMSRAELAWLAQQASQCDRLIEVGCFLGRSTVVLAEHVKHQMYAVDPWQKSWERELHGGWHRFLLDHPDRYREFLATTDRYWRAGKLSVLRGDLRQLPVAGVDMVFIDGSHLWEAVVSDCREGHLRLKPGGLLAGHDYGDSSWPQVQAVVDRLYYPKVTNPVGSIWAVRV